MALVTKEKRSYSPYSSKQEYCIVESTGGKRFAGVRIENISYPLTIPAVQAACCICLSEGEIPSKLYIREGKLDQIDFWVREFNLQIIETPALAEMEVEDLYQQGELRDVKPLLKDLLSQAVVPESDFPVSAVLFTENGYFTGVNVEVHDWTKGLCAERVALSKAFAAGHTDFKSIEIHTKKGEVSSPCGACRQVIIEHLPFHPVKLHHADGTLSEHMSVDLLPFNFKTSNLKK